MTLSLNKPKLDNLASDIWKSAERLRGKFKSYEYQSVILPIIVIRRLECVLIDWRVQKSAEVRKNRPTLSEKEVAKWVKGLELNPQQCPFSNRTDWTLRSVYAEDQALLEDNFRAYINGFSRNVDDIIEHFNYRGTIGLMVKNNRLAPILNQYKELALGPGELSGLEMGYIYEELLRRFSEQSGDEAGEHFTPREVIRLMVELLDIPIPERHLSIYDPASGTGGMLSVAKEHLFYNTGIFTYVWLLRNDKPASHQGRVMLIDARGQFEKEPKSFSAANLKKEQEFHASDLSFRVQLKVQGEEKTVAFTVTPKDNAAKRFKEALAGAGETLAVEWTHRHYVQDDEYIPHGEDIAAFLTREIAKPIIRWEETKKDGKPILGYEILPNKYLYRYQPPRPAQDLLAEFWQLEKEAEKMLEGLAK
ncbi:N-6 DNA methylase [uncultured Thiodictyon sp.]|jgi:hypothetical protein|uniref:type I restriction-modification system subunit M n=1 Tax=uncultured Thiodictyon sp. TaxID=1846217 RepID=UPI0025ED3B47|nr:N-6 DNA methylase [uncultured Thiodictyon sp.]